MRAQLCVERIDTRWRKKADHPDVFRAEMDEIIEHLRTVSSPGTPSPTARRPQLRRMLLEKAKCHVYFVIDEREQHASSGGQGDGATPDDGLPLKPPTMPADPRFAHSTSWIWLVPPL
ncbi:MAG TPA: hypothetical protein VJN18_18940 [Polyangiaceae bacterium]|nr:hypothetical protein [Polyangiaceae bacterium]